MTAVRSGLWLAAVNTLRLPSPAPLSQLLESGPLALFLDFDGTLVELASGPDAIAVRSGLKSALLRLAEQLEGRLGLVSGRSIADLEKHLGALPLAVAGSHGADIRDARGRSLGAPAKGVSDEARAALRAFAASNALNLEEKPHGAALHFRSNPDMEEHAHGFAKEVAEHHGLATKRGKCVVELIERGRDKGGAVNVLMASAPFTGARAFFIGDDVTDEDGFAACQALGGAGILVGERGESNAAYALAGVAAVHHWLELEFDPT